MRILFIDDDIELCESVKELLEDLGHEVHCSFTVPAALDYLSGPQATELIIVDFHMPMRNGLDLMKEGRHLIKDIPSVLFTGHIHPSDERRAKELGFAAVFVKPMPMEELMRHLELKFFSLARI